MNGRPIATSKAETLLNTLVDRVAFGGYDGFEDGEDEEALSWRQGLIGATAARELGIPAEDGDEEDPPDLTPRECAVVDQIVVAVEEYLD